MSTYKWSPGNEKWEEQDLKKIVKKVLMDHCSGCYTARRYCGGQFYVYR